MPPRRPAKREAAVRPAPAPAVREITGPMYVDTERGQFVDRSRTGEPVLTARQFEAEHARLVREFGEAEENPGSLSCHGCRHCSSCMFCEECEACYRCTHCARCLDSSHLTHCHDCKGCHESAYCVRCESCIGSSYLVLCRSCSDCTYCFGCVGLAKKDFHILNVSYTKTEYFRIMKALRAEMRL